MENGIQLSNIKFFFILLEFLGLLFGLVSHMFLIMILDYDWIPLILTRVVPVLLAS